MCPRKIAFCYLALNESIHVYVKIWYAALGFLMICSIFRVNRFKCESFHFLFESIHQFLWPCLNQFILCMNRINPLLGILSRFKYLLTRSILHPFFSPSCFVLYGLNRFIKLVDRFTQLLLCENLVLSPLSINSLLLTTPNLLNHLQLFSLGLKNSLFIHSSRLNTFS